jgi:hypothetical protein
MKSKACFFAKKKQKTLINMAAWTADNVRASRRVDFSPPTCEPRRKLVAYAEAQWTKVFLLLFLQKKKTLPGVQCA